MNEQKKKELTSNEINSLIKDISAKDITSGSLNLD